MAREPSKDQPPASPDTLPETAPALTLNAMGAALARGPDGAALTALGAKSLALLIYVAMQPGQTATRDSLVELLWPRGDADQGRASLRQELRRMKKAMGEVFDLAVDAPPGQVALRPGRVRLDALELEKAAESRDSAGLAATPGLYGGAFLAPLAVNEGPFQDWVSIQNSRLEEVTTEALLRLMLLDEAAGRLDRAASAARTLLGIDPFQEDVHASLIRIHAAAGRIGAAKAQLERCRKLFIEELDEDPGPALAALIPDARGRRAAAGEPPRPAAGRAAPTNRGPRRALAALSVRADETAPPEIAALAPRAGAALIAQLGPCCWLGLGLPDALAAAGAEAGLFDRASCLAAISLSEDAGRLRAEITVAARPEGEATVSRTVFAPLDGELDPAVALARAAAPVLNAAFLAAAEAEGAAEEDPAGVDAWAGVMRAHRLLRAGDAPSREAARKILEPIVKAEPDFTEALCLLSLAHLGDVTHGAASAPREAMFRARELALRAVRRRPDGAWPHYALGAATALTDDPLAAQSHHLHALRLAPGFAPAMGEIARGLAFAGDAAEAEAWAERALAAGPADPMAPDHLHALALARFAGGDWAGAAEAAAQARAARPLWAPPALVEAAARRRMGDETGAARARAAAGPFEEESLRAAHPFHDRALTEALAAELESAKAAAE